MSIKIDLKIFLFAILFYFTKQIEMYAFLMFFAFIHELGHLLCGLAIGFSPSSIKVNPFGFQIYFKPYSQDYAQKVKQGTEIAIKKILVALAGPLVNLLIVGLCFLFSKQIGDKGTTIIYANIVLVIFNLLPIYPLDGGRILLEVVHILKGKEKAYEVTNYIAKVAIIILTMITSVVILYIHNIAFLILLSYLWYLVIKNEKRYQINRKIYELLN